MKTAVDVIAKAISDAFDGRPGWDERCAIAALAALEAFHLPNHALAMGFDAGGGRCGAIREEFKAIIRALKEEKK